MDFMKPFSGLDGREKDVFSELLAYNYKYKDLPKKERNQLIFNASCKREMMVNIGMESIEVFNNKLTALRKKGLIEKDSEGNFIPEKLANNLTKFDNLIFKFTA